MMPPIDRERLADEVLVLTQEMLAAAEENRWDDLDGMEEERERLIAALFADLEPGCVGDGEWVAVVRDVQTHNDALLKMAVRQRNRSAQELLTFRSARKAESVYAHAMDGEEP